MKITKHIIILSFLLSTTYIFAQNEDDNYDPANFIENQEVSKTSKVENNENQTEGIDNKENSKISYNIEVGTSIMTSSYGTAMNFYTAPQINYNFTPKLQFSMGVLIMNSTIPNSFINENSNVNSTNAYLINKISYQATEKLRISGEILYGLNNNSYNPNGYNKNKYMVNFDAEYKINDSFSIGVQVSSHNLNSPYSYSNPFAPTNNNYNSPFGGF